MPDGEMTETAASPEVEQTAAQISFVEGWSKKVRAARKRHEKAFKRMNENMQFAKDGADKNWMKGDLYVVPLSNRYINLAVSQLYARNPRIEAKRRPRLLHTVWDGDQSTLSAAMQSSAQALQMGMPPDPNALAIIQDAMQAKEYQHRIDKFARTMENLANYYLNEQDLNFKSSMKAVVRRAKVCGAAWVKLNFQRILEKRPEISARISDATAQLAEIEAQTRLSSEFSDDDPRAEQLRQTILSLQGQEEVLVREGPVFDYPRTDQIIVDPKVQHLKTLAGCAWVAHEFEFTSEEILATYGVDVRGEASDYRRDDAEGEKPVSEPLEEDAKDRSADPKDGCHRVWEIWDKTHGYVFTICEGFKKYLKAPEHPAVAVERFFPFFPLVFNEIESKDEIYPPSDLELMRHPQMEYNRSRQGLREHRTANRPAYVSLRGAIEDTDLAKFQDHVANEILQIKGQPNQKIDDVLQRKPVVPIDPNVYEVSPLYDDMMRSTGAQEANFGSTSGATATESSIAENSRAASNSDNVDDLDTVLSDIARAMGQVMISELSEETVKEIVGPGAVWPQMSRDEIAKEVALEVRAGSSGRPNQAAELAKMERAAPYLLQIPGINPEPLARRYLAMLDLDIEDAIVQGMPSITAMNAMMGRPQAPTGDAGEAPDAQGARGAANTETAGGNEGLGQPAYPAGGAPGALQ